MSSKKPNILWIMTDQQSANMMSCAGNPYLSTPNMDLLTQDGVRYTNAYCTNPVCIPSRFSLFTGLYPSAVGMRSNYYEEELYQGRLPKYILENGFGKLMKLGGYRAVYGGKEHFPGVRASDLGFDYICEDERDILADVCVDYLLNYKDDQPYFMVASFINPHDICYMAITDHGRTPLDMELIERSPVEVETMRNAQKMPPGVLAKEFYERVCPPLPPNYLPAKDEPEAISIMQSKRPFKKLARENYSDNDWRLHRYTYARLTELVDRQIGKVLDAVIKRGDWDQTVIIFTSDHGDMDASHKMEHKSMLYNECCKIPLIIKGISSKPGGKTCDAIVSNGLDLICTVLDYASAPLPSYPLEGISLKDTAEQVASDIPREALIVESEYGAMAVDKKSKYIRYNVGENAEQFYDFSTNPYEMYNQIEDKLFKDKLQTLKQFLELHEAKRGSAVTT